MQHNNTYDKVSGSASLNVNSRNKAGQMHHQINKTQNGITLSSQSKTGGFSFKERSSSAITTHSTNVL